MNPVLDRINQNTGKTELIFDSSFESGNLDRVYKVKEFEYDMYMRVDTNTSGHHQWFYFSCAYHQQFKGKTVTFNFKNFTKEDSLYSAGMRVAIS